MPDDQTALGFLLLEMGLITEKQLAEIIDLQEKIRQDAKLGRLLVRRGFCKKEDIERALGHQQRLRKTDPTHRALMMAELAVKRKRRPSAIGQRTRAVSKSQQVWKSISDEYPDVSEMAAEDTVVESSPVKEYPALKGSRDDDSR